MHVFKKIANSAAQALRVISTRVKIKTTCLLYDILCHILIFMIHEEFRFKNLSKGWNVERSGKVVYLLVIFVVFENTYNANCLLSKVLKTYRCFATFSKCTLNSFKWSTNGHFYNQITCE